MTNLLDLLKDVDTGSVELQKEELSAKSTGSKYVNVAGVYSGTIERAYLTETKKGGVALNIHIGGESIADFVIYPVRKDKNGKKVSTQEYNGKTTSISDYLLLKQFVFCATGKGQALEDIKLVGEEIKFKKFGKEVTVEGATLVDVIGKQIKFGVRAEEEYNYENGATDKTSLRTDNEGKVKYKLSLYSVYSTEGKIPAEAIKGEDAKQIESDTIYLTSDKAIKKLKLEASEDEAPFDVAEEDDIQF